LANFLEVQPVVRGDRLGRRQGGIVESALGVGQGHVAQGGVVGLKARQNLLAALGREAVLTQQQLKGGHGLLQVAGEARMKDDRFFRRIQGGVAKILHAFVALLEAEEDDQGHRGQNRDEDREIQISQDVAQDVSFHG
jgi:hypothetical protein